jgi:MFS family permease
VPDDTTRSAENGPTDEESGRECVETLEADEEAPPASIARQGGTFESFRSRDFGLFWAGAFISNTGSWMQSYALAIVVYALRRSELDSGLVNFVSGIPVLFLSIPAGAIADQVDRRKLLIASQLVLGAQAVALAILYTGGHLSPGRGNAGIALAWIASLGLLAGVMAAMTFPAWQSLLPDLVPRESLLNAIALNSAQFQSARLLGPLAAAGVVLVGGGMGEICWLNAASFLFVIAALRAIHPRPRGGAAVDAPSAGGRREGAWRTLTAGLTYARENRTIGLLVLSTAVMTIFGMPYMMLLPAYADKVLGGGRELTTSWTAWLMAANGLGAVAGALVVASLKRGTKRTRVIPWALVAFAAVLIAFSLSRWLWLSIPLSVLGGAGVLTVNSLTNTTIQSDAPPRLRGRVMALFVMAFLGIMPVSSLLFGFLGRAVGPGNAILAGGIVLLGWGAFLVSRPDLLLESGAGAGPAT